MLMQFTLDSHLEKFSSMQPCIFIGYLRNGYEGKSVVPVTLSNYRLEQVRKHP